MKKSVLGTYGLQILNVFFSFFMSILLARLLGAEERGVLVLFITSSSFISTIIEFCMGSAITYYIASGIFPVNKTFTTLIYWTFITLLIIIVITLLAPYIGIQQFLYGQSSINFSLKVYFVVIITLSVFNSLLSAIFSGVKNFKIINLLTIGSLGLTTLLYFLYLILEIKFGLKFNTEYIALTTTLVLVIRSIAMIILYSKKVSIYPSRSILSSSDIKALFSLSLINYISNTVLFLTYKMDFWFVTYYNGSKALGIYSLAVNLAQLFWMLPNSVGVVLFPNIASMNRQEALHHTQMLCRIIFTFTLIFGAIAGCLLAFFIPYIYGIQFTLSTHLLIILLIGVLPFSIKIIIASYYAGINKTNIDMLGSVMTFIFCLAFDILLIPKYGVTGAAIATIIAYVCNTLFMIITFKKMTNSSLNSFLVMKKSDIKLITQFIYAKIKLKPNSVS